MARPLVSVVLTTYNRADLVGSAIESVLAQTYPNLELVVVDDASEDGTPAAVEAFDDERIDYVRHEENRHLSAARNTGIARADGEYVAFLDDDDRWHPEKLERQVDLLERSSPSVGLVYCWMEYRRDGTTVREYRPTVSGDIFAEALGGQPLGNGSTFLIRDGVFAEVGTFDEDLRRGIDGDFVRRVARTYEVDYVPEVLVTYTVGHGSERITRHDEEGLRNAIEANRAKLRKFPAELDEHPRQKANVYARLAYRHYQLSEWREAAGYLVRTVVTGARAPTAYADLTRAYCRRVQELYGSGR